MLSRAASRGEKNGLETFLVPRPKKKKQKRKSLAVRQSVPGGRIYRPGSACGVIRARFKKRTNLNPSPGSCDKRRRASCQEKSRLPLPTELVGFQGCLPATTDGALVGLCTGTGGAAYHLPPPLLVPATDGGICCGLTGCQEPGAGLCAGAGAEPAQEPVHHGHEASNTMSARGRVEITTGWRRTDGFFFKSSQGFRFYRFLLGPETPYQRQNGCRTVAVPTNPDPQTSLPPFSNN